jgi:hypothetical protein
MENRKILFGSPFKGIGTGSFTARHFGVLLVKLKFLFLATVIITDLALPTVWKSP